MNKLRPDKRGVPDAVCVAFKPVNDCASLVRVVWQSRWQDVKGGVRSCGCKVEERNICKLELQSHIGDPLNIQWLKMAAFLVHGRQSCVDGRDDSGSAHSACFTR